MNEPAVPPPDSDDADTSAGETSPIDPPLESEDGVPATAASADSASGPDDEGLPEWEPLTPELVEDEAIRGDFMLRWAVILLATLMGWTLVQESAVLTHIKSGEALLAAGGLPSGHDPLASTTGDSRWVQLSWLFDAVLSTWYGLAGQGGLSLLKAIVAGLIFYTLAQISRPGVPTWWGSVCGALALVACFPNLTATPHIVTLLGMTVLMWLLHRRMSSAAGGFPWGLVVTILAWNQFDDRAWIGAICLLAYALGHQWDLRTAQQTDELRSGSLLPVAVVGGLALLLHPFLWESWWSPLRLYQLGYPAQRAYFTSEDPFLYHHFPAWSPQYWSLNYFNGAALLLWMTTLIVLILNRTRVPKSHLVLFVTMTAIAAAGGTELAVGSLVFAALATLNAQQWYTANFRQSYSIETSELLFSRGGRAVTVIALFALAFLMVAGHLTGAGGRRVGTGFDPRLAETIDSYQALLADAYDDRPFAFRPDQGDILNWVGDHPFIDSRLRLFAGGQPSIIDEHLQARSALRLPRDGSQPDRAQWQAILDKYEINQALPRLSGESPDYVTFGDLMISPDWELTGMDAATAVFCRTDRNDPELALFVAQHRETTQIAESLRRNDDDDKVTELRTVWPQSPSVYSQYFYQPLPPFSRAVQRARHSLALADRGGSAAQVVPAVYAAIRNVHRGLADSPNDPTAYLILAQAYETLWRFERGVMQAQNLMYPDALRFAQTTSAYHHALDCNPRHAEAHLRLFALYSQMQRHDLALRYLEDYERLTGRLTMLAEDHPEFEADQTRMAEYLEALRVQVNEVRRQRDDDLAAGIDRQTLAQSLANGGYTLAALEVIESDLTMVSGQPGLAFLYARLLLEAGRTREAFEQFQGLSVLAVQGQLPDWAAYAAISATVAEDLNAALATLDEEQVQLAVATASAWLMQHPLQAFGPTDGREPVNPLIPLVRRMQLAGMYFEQFRPRLEANMLNRALILLELGRNTEARDLLLELLLQNPVSSLRPVAVAYLTLLADPEAIPPIPDAAELTATLPSLSEGQPQQPSDEDPAAEPAAKDNTTGAADSPAKSDAPPATKDTPTNDTPPEAEGEQSDSQPVGD